MFPEVLSVLTGQPTFYWRHFCLGWPLGPNRDGPGVSAALNPLKSTFWLLPLPGSGRACSMARPDHATREYEKIAKSAFLLKQFGFGHTFIAWVPSCILAIMHHIQSLRNPHGWCCSLMYAGCTFILIRIEPLVAAKGRTSQRPVDDPDLFSVSTGTTTLAE